MTTDTLEQSPDLPLPAQSPQRPSAVKYAKEEAAAALKMLNSRQKRRDRKEKRARQQTKEQKEERQLRLRQARATLEEALAQEPLVIASTAIVGDLDEVEPESEFNCFDCKFEPSEQDSERRLLEWISSEEASTAAPELVAFLRESSNVMEDFGFIIECHDLRLQGNVVPTTLCKLIFELVVYGEPATSNSAWSLLNYLIQHPVDIGFWDGLKSKSDSEQSARPGIACGLEWFPSDTFFVEAWKALGYVRPGVLSCSMSTMTTSHGTSIKIVEQECEAPAAKVFCKPAALTRPKRHPWARRVERICRLITLLEQTYHKQHPGSDPSVPPPFGNSPEFAAMLCRAVADATLPTARATVAAAIASYVSMPFPGNDAEWGRVYVAALRDLRTDLPSSQALVRMCRGISGNTRCDMMRQALAMLYIEGLHGGENKLELEDVSSVPVLPVIQKLPGWREMLKTLTPEGDEVPFGWEVLSTAEFLFLLTEPVIAQQLTAARGGTCPTDAIYRVLVPLLQELAKGLKNRRTVSVFRTRLLCASLSTYYAEVHSTLRGVAQAKLEGQGPISLLSSQ